MLEPAHQLVYGFATLPWELTGPQPMVSYFLGFLHAGPLLISKALGWSGMTEAGLLRTLSGLFNATRVIAFFLILPQLGIAAGLRGLLTGLFALGPFGLVLMVRTTQENWATTALLWATYFALRAEAAGARQQLRDLALAGLLAGLAAAFRFQTGICALALTLFCIWRFGWKAAVVLSLGVLLGLGPLALVDTYFTGTPFLPAMNYLKYALGNEDGGEVWGTSAWHFYVLGYLTTVYPPYSIPLVPLVLRGLKKVQLLAALIIPFVIAHFVLGHKEHRYLFPILPLFFLAGAVGYTSLSKEYLNSLLKKRWTASAWQALPKYALVSCVLWLLLAFVPLNPAPRLYQQLGDLEDQGRLPQSYTYVANSRSQIALFYNKHPDRLPAHIDINTFIDALQKNTLAQGTYAFYRMDSFVLREVEKACSVQFLSIPGRIRDIMEGMSPILRKVDLDAIVYCPGKV